MCTVTFIPVKDKYYITSNRDEKFSRQQALPPAVYTVNGAKIMFPKDANAGGTWIALHENGNAAVLLNGAFVKHIPQPSYKKSRGIIFLEIITAAIPSRYFSKINLEGIEPFTIILLENNNLYECRWDATEKHCRQLKNYQPYIWSSATLYNAVIVKKREQWFAAFLNTNPTPSQESILHFHQFTGDGDSHNDLQMVRNGFMKTVSVTGMCIGQSNGSMEYGDLKDNKQYRKDIDFTTSLIGA